MTQTLNSEHNFAIVHIGSLGCLWRLWQKHVVRPRHKVPCTLLMGCISGTHSPRMHWLKDHDEMPGMRIVLCYCARVIFQMARNMCTPCHMTKRTSHIGKDPLRLSCVNICSACPLQLQCPHALEMHSNLSKEHMLTSQQKGKISSNWTCILIAATAKCCKHSCQANVNPIP